MMRRLACLARQNHRYFPIIKKSNHQHRRSNEWAAQSGYIVKNRSDASLCRGFMSWFMPPLRFASSHGLHAKVSSLIEVVVIYLKINHLQGCPADRACRAQAWQSLRADRLG
jgi:hypothetical protein